MTPDKLAVSTKLMEKRIFLIRTQKVMLDFHLAELYGVETGALNRAVKRNIDRFPKDFMLQLTKKEDEDLKCQFGISSSSWGGRRRSMPYAFTEQGVAMLSSVLKSKRAITVNIAIMRAFVRLREILATHKDIARRLEKLELHVGTIMDVLDKIMAPSKKRTGRIGFKKN